MHKVECMYLYKITGFKRTNTPCPADKLAKQAKIYLHQQRYRDTDQFTTIRQDVILCREIKIS